jgi:hypothetical protein
MMAFIIQAAAHDMTMRFAPSEMVSTSLTRARLHELPVLSIFDITDNMDDWPDGIVLTGRRDEDTM